MNSNHTKIVSRFALFYCNRFSMDDLWSMILCRSVCKRPDKVFPLDSNKQLTVYISAWSEEDWHKTGRKLQMYQMNRQGPGGPVSGHSLIEISERQWQDSASNNIRFNFVTKLNEVLYWESVEEKAGLWYAALNKQLVGHRVVSNTAEEWSRRSWGQAVASLIGCTQTGLNHQGWVWQKQVSKNEQNCGV